MTINSSRNHMAMVRPSYSVLVTTVPLLCYQQLFYLMLYFFPCDLLSIDARIHPSLTPSPPLYSHISGRTSTCIQGRSPPRPSRGEYHVSNISVFPLSCFCALARSLALLLSLPFDAAGRLSVTVCIVLAAASLSLSLCSLCQHPLLLWSSPLPWTTLPLTRPMLRYSDAFRPKRGSEAILV